MSEVGIIGQIYEDRRTHKKGKLLERDEKYKTLLMESDDGKSFNITYGGFKSNWRKVDEEVPTIEEAMQEVEVPVEVADKISIEPKKKPKKKSTNKDVEVSPRLEEAVKVLVEYVDSFSSGRLTLAPKFEKKTVAIRLDGGKVVEFVYSPKKDGFTACSKEVFAKVADKLNYIDGVRYYEKWNTVNYAFFVTSSKFNNLLNDLRPAFVSILSREENE